MTKLSITVKGKFKTWTFTTDADPSSIEQYRRDGLEVDEIYNAVPEYVPHFLAGLWFRLEDIYNFRFLTNVQGDK